MRTKSSHILINFALNKKVMNISIKNFRIIGEDGIHLDFTPVTFLTGCNSSGKSSITKAILLMNNFLKDLKDNNYNIIDTPLDFSKIVKLGNFDEVLNKDIKQKGSTKISFAYSFKNGVFKPHLHVEYIFSPRTNDFLNNAWIDEIIISTDKNKLFSIQVIDKKYQLNILDKEKFVEYYNLFLVKQLVSVKKIADNRAKSSEDFKTDEEIEEFYNNINKLDLSKIDKLDKEFVEKGILYKNITYSTYNRSILENLQQYGVWGISENLLETKNIDFSIYKLEQEKSQKITIEESEQLINKIGEQTIQTRIERAKNLSKEFIKKQSDSLDERLRIYVNEYLCSSSKDIFDYLTKEKTKILDSIIAEFNSDDAQFMHDYYNSNILEILKRSSLLKVRPIEFIGIILQEALTPSWLNNIGYVDSSTVEVKRLYPLDFSDRFGNLVKEYNSLVTNKRINSSNYVPGDFLNKWLKEFQLGEELKLNNIEGALSIRLVQEDIPNGRLLADYGYGVTQLIALLIQIEIALGNVKEGEYDDFVGDDYGGWITQIHPILLIEEPEVHLHPSLQSKLADMFLDASIHGVGIIAETHSEYMIRRSQVIVAEKFKEKTDYKPDFKVYYCPMKQAPYDMEYRSDGCFMNEFGPGFFDEASNLAFKLF